MTLAQIENGRTAARAKLQKLREHNREQEGQLEQEIVELNRQEKLALAGLDLSKIMLAEHVLSIRMSEGLAGDDKAMIALAVADLAGGAKGMRTGFYGSKNYDRWYHQGENLTQYGHGPKHGSIVFAIGLAKPHIPKNKDDSPRDLTADEIDAAIYLLKMLEAGKYVTPSMATKTADS